LFTVAVKLLEIIFHSPDLAERCSSQAQRDAAWPGFGQEVGQRLFQLDAVDSLDDAGLVPGIRIDPLAAPRFLVSAGAVSFVVSLVESKLSGGDGPGVVRLLLEEVRVSESGDATDG
jgi:hypothetical protein